MPRDALRQILELLGQEQACYTSLLDLSRRQKRLLQRRAMAELQPLLQSKQRAMDRLDRIESRLRPFKEQWQVVRTQLDRNERQILDMALGTAEELVSELIASERESEAILENSVAA